MTETQEVAQGMLAAYLAHIGRVNGPVCTAASAAQFVNTDAILCDESQTVRDAISEELYKLARATFRNAETHAHPEGTDQTSRDVYWIAHAKALALQTGSRGSFAAIIGDAFIRADSRNAARLIAAFPELLAG